MAVKSIGATDPVQVYAKPAYGRQGRPFHLVNLDTTSPVYYDDNISVTAQSNVLYPLGRAGFDGNSDVFASTITPGITVLVQSLAGHTGWDAGPVQTAAALQRFGVPPVVPNMKSASVLGAGAGGGGVFFTFPAPAHIWGCHLSMAGGSNTSFTGGVVLIYGRVMTGSGVTVGGPCELAFSGPNQTAEDNADPSYPGIPVAGGDTLTLDPNNGVGLVNGVFHCSATVFYSIP